MRRNRKHKSLGIVLAILFLFFMVETVRIFLGNHVKVSILEVRSYLKNTVAMEMVKTLSPNLLYPFEKEKNRGDCMESFFLQSLPVLKYVNGMKPLETVVENEGAYELILRGEANDENFVDENGNVVIVGEVQEETKPEPTKKPEEVKEQVAKKGEKVKEIDFTILGDEQQVKNTYYTIDSTTYVETGELNGNNMLAKDMTIKGSNEKPQILIYHTHSQEGFVDSLPGDSSTTIVGVGAYLAELLRNNYQYNVIHNTATYDLINGKLDRNEAYSLAEGDIQRILKENPSIEVVIDLHRDAMDENTRLVTEIDGKQTARFMFFNGMSRTTRLGEIGYLPNPYRGDNLSFSFQLQIKAEEYYPGLTRKIYLKGYRYNMHLIPKTILVECGAQNNTLQEEKNAMEPLAHILNMVLRGEN